MEKKSPIIRFGSASLAKKIIKPQKTDLLKEEVKYFEGAD